MLHQIQKSSPVSMYRTLTNSQTRQKEGRTYQVTSASFDSGRENPRSNRVECRWNHLPAWVIQTPAGPQPTLRIWAIESSERRCPRRWYEGAVKIEMGCQLSDLGCAYDFLIPRCERGLMFQQGDWRKLSRPAATVT